MRRSSDQLLSNAERIGQSPQANKRLKDKLELHADLTSRLDSLESLISMVIEENDDSLSEETSDLAALEQDIGRARISALLSGEYDASDAILGSCRRGRHRGADWALMHIACTSGPSRAICTVLSCIDGEEAGIKSADLLIEGENAYGYLKSRRASTV